MDHNGLSGSWIGILQHVCSEKDSNWQRKSYFPCKHPHAVMQGHHKKTTSPFWAFPYEARHMAREWGTTEDWTCWCLQNLLATYCIMRWQSPWVGGGRPFPQKPYYFLLFTIDSTAATPLEKHEIYAPPPPSRVGWDRHWRYVITAYRVLFPAVGQGSKVWSAAHYKKKKKAWFYPFFVGSRDRYRVMRGSFLLGQQSA